MSVHPISFARRSDAFAARLLAAGTLTPARPRRRQPGWWMRWAIYAFLAGATAAAVADWLGSLPL